MILVKIICILILIILLMITSGSIVQVIEDLKHNMIDKGVLGMRIIMLFWVLLAIIFLIKFIIS